LASVSLGSRLREERLAQRRTLDDISAITKIPVRFLEAIETGDFDRLPGLIFTRNFVRQYALALKLDPAALLDALPKHDESSIKLPDPPPPRRPSSTRDPRSQSFLSSVAWLLLAGGAGSAAYIYFNHSNPPVASSQSAVTTVKPAVPQSAAPVPQPAIAQPAPAGLPVQVVFTAHQPAWVQVSADGKTAFTGTLQSNETREVSAAEQVRISTGNAGALTISLNGKTLESLGSLGQVRAVKLTAEGPQYPPKDSPPPDPL
jgi:cytoskeleton protein RodZ